MSFKVDDEEWRETVRGFFFHLWGESLKDIPEDEEGTFHDGDGVEHPFHGKAELIEVMFNNTFKNGFADALKLFLRRTRFLSSVARPFEDASNVYKVTPGVPGRLGCYFFSTRGFREAHERLCHANLPEY